MIRKRRTLGVCGAAAALALLLAAAAGADPAGAALAPPGECAQAREALGAAQDDDALVPEVIAGDGFDVAGSPRHHFTPGDVALGAGAPAAPPVAPAFSRDPCDAPLAGCRSILDARSDVVIEEEGPGTGGSPGTGGERSGGGE